MRKKKTSVLLVQNCNVLKHNMVKCCPLVAAKLHSRTMGYIYIHTVLVIPIFFISKAAPKYSVSTNVVYGPTTSYCNTHYTHYLLLEVCIRMYLSLWINPNPKT